MTRIQQECYMMLKLQYRLYNKIRMSDEEYTVLFSEQDYLNLQKTCETLESKLKAAEEAKKLITGKYDALTEKYENLNQEKVRLQLQSQHLNSDYSKLVHEKEANIRQLQKCNQELTLINKVAEQQHSSTVTEYNMKLNSLKVEVCKLEKSLKDRSEQNELLNQQMKKQQKNTLNISKQLNDCIAEIKALKEAISVKERQNEAGKLELENTKKQLFQVESELQQSRNCQDDFKKVRANSEKQLKQIGSELKKMIDENKQLREQANQYKESCKSLQQTAAIFEQSKQKFVILQAQFQKIKKYNEMLLREAQKNKQVPQQEQYIDLLKNQLATTHQKMSNLQSEMTILQKNREEMSKEYQSIIADLEKKLAKSDKLSQLKENKSKLQEKEASKTKPDSKTDRLLKIKDMIYSHFTQMAISLFEMNEVISKKEVVEILSQEKDSLTKFVEDVCKEFIEQS